MSTVSANFSCLQSLKVWILKSDSLLSSYKYNDFLKIQSLPVWTFVILLYVYYFYAPNNKRSSDVAYISRRVVILVRAFGNGPDNRFPMRELHMLEKVNTICSKKIKIYYNLSESNSYFSRQKNYWQWEWYMLYLSIQVLQLHSSPFRRNGSIEVVTTEIPALIIKHDYHLTMIITLKV